MRTLLLSAAVLVPLLASGEEATLHLVRVRVLYGDGPAPAGVAVSLQLNPTQKYGHGPRRGPPVHTNADGWAEFKDMPGGKYLVHADSGALGHLSTSIYVPSDPTVLRYQKGVTVFALITDAQGRPAAGARVELAAKAGKTGDCVASTADLSSYCIVRTAEAWSDGRVAFQGLAGGTYAVLPSSNDHGRGQGVMAVANGPEVTVRQPAERLLSGKVTDARGKPLAEKARVVASAVRADGGAWRSAPKTFDALLQPPSDVPEDARGRGVDASADGSFGVPLAFGGEVELYALTGDCAHTPKVRARVGDQKVVLAMPAAAPVSGRLVSAKGTSLPPTVKLESWCGDLRTCRVEALPLKKDRFTIPDVQSSCEWVSIDAGAAGQATIKPKTTPGKATDVGEVTLETR